VIPVEVPKKKIRMYCKSANNWLYKFHILSIKFPNYSNTII
jgi:hypothetical protein